MNTKGKRAKKFEKDSNAIATEEEDGEKYNVGRWNK